MSSNLSSHHSLKDMTLSKLINRTDTWILHYNTEIGIVPFSQLTSEDSLKILYADSILLLQIHSQLVTVIIVPCLLLLSDRILKQFTAKHCGDAKSWLRVRICQDRCQTGGNICSIKDERVIFLIHKELIEIKIGKGCKARHFTHRAIQMVSKHQQRSSTIFIIRTKTC